MKIQRILLITISLFSLTMAGCASRVVTNTSTFYKPDYKSQGTIVVTSTNMKTSKSLEFEHYKSKFESYLSKAGYVPVKSPAEAQYIAIVSYGIDNGKGSIETTPIFGQTGGGTTYTSGTVYSGGHHSTSYSGSTYTMPTYGVIGSSTSSYTTYSRAIAMDIVIAKSFLQGEPKVLLESRAKSSGSCSQIVEVFDEILEAMFDDFPGESGRSRRVVVRGEANC
ncbi:hypothetical protein MNBD_GAMMA21-1405 [hydrothermal vent metagenome]|uniref:DUF4136 domain-containing protein n=1 Tax=hydrothermal vent metagenome TaxID=652676 RepID=A0A3B1AIZ6_9ZZZZ